ncbi:hypothetical protein TeGR_g5832 [Tetraparma gracilis]|uniref:START domain-containing protein n=1 Tax=Tetraparma gracilis TaxID=2962635 RepID=A0ABQ6MDX0_9STRA|nr:hypothetical protein TeGR_g5832 [Tetraparma gracilis]
MEASAEQNADQRPIKTPSVLDNAYMVTSKDGSVSTVRALGTIRASADKVAAQLFNFLDTMYINLTDTATRKLLGQPNDRHIIVHIQEPAPSPFRDRDFVLCMVYTPISATEHFIAAIDVEHEEAPVQSGVVRASLLRSLRILQIAPGVCRLTITSQMDVRGSVPRKVNNTFVAPMLSVAALSTVRLFMHVKDPAAMEAADAKVLGQLLVLDMNEVRGKSDAQQLEGKLGTFVDRTAALRSVQDEFPWFETLLLEALRNRLRLQKGSSKALADFKEEDARKAGRAFANALVANVTPVAAVDEWVMTYPALGELELRFPFVRPMMNAVASEILAQVPWGVKFRAYLGAGVSVVDGASDAYMVKKFYEMGNTGAAEGLLAMVGGNLAMQMLNVYTANEGLKKDKGRTMLRELLYVVTFVRPGVDAHRVASGAEQLPGAATTPLQEMLFTKGCELVFEAIPGLVLQLAALLVAEEKNTSAIISIFISAASTALTSTTLFWDHDTDPFERKRGAEWIGIIPDVGRGSAFAVAFMMITLQVFAKAAATALLAVTNKSWLLGYFAVDHALHLVYRLMRQDLPIMTPMPATLTYLVSPIVRIVFKTINDFTGSPVFRLPLLLGGAYWLFSLIASQASVFFCVHLYNEYAEAPSDDVDKIEANALWAGAGGLAAAWLCAFAYFAFWVAVPEYRHTLWSWHAGRFSRDDFLKIESDEGKFGLFDVNLLLWESENGEDMKAWTAENWARWKAEKPAWFVVEKVPDQFIPAAELAQLGHNRKRRGSAAGSVRESFREGAGEGAAE